MTLGDPPGSARYDDLLRATRGLLDAVAAAHAPDDVVDEVAKLVHQAAERLAPFAVGEREAPSGNRPDLPGRGHPLVPPFVIDVEDPDRVTGTVRLSRAHLGGGDAAHGGVLPLLFDEVLGRLVAHGREPSRTAYLHVDYRQLTPLDVDLRVEAEIIRHEGRKLFATGRLLKGEVVLAECEGLFVQAREGGLVTQTEAAAD